MFLHKRWLFLVVMLFVLFIGVAVFPVYAQDGPNHTGPPVITTKVTDEPVLYAIPPCDTLYGYAYKAQITLVSQDNLFRDWYGDNGSPVYTSYKIKEHVNITALYPDGTLGKSVDLKLDFAGSEDQTTGISELSGLRSAIIQPDGGLEVVNAGHIVLKFDEGFGAVRGEVLSQSGHWDAVEGTRFDHIKYACDLVSD